MVDHCQILSPIADMLANRQSKQTGENITSLTEVMTKRMSNLEA